APIAAAVADVDRSVGERIADRLVELAVIADLADGLHRSGEIHAVARQNRRIGADLWATRGCLVVGTEMIVEAPVAQTLAHGQQLDSFLGIAAMGHHAVEWGEGREDLAPFSVPVSNAHARSVAKRKRVGAAER